MDPIFIQIVANLIQIGPWLPQFYPSFHSSSHASLSCASYSKNKSSGHQSWIDAINKNYIIFLLTFLLAILWKNCHHGRNKAKHVHSRYYSILYVFIFKFSIYGDNEISTVQCEKIVRWKNTHSKYTVCRNIGNWNDETIYHFFTLRKKITMEAVQKNWQYSRWELLEVSTGIEMILLHKFGRNSFGNVAKLLVNNKEAIFIQFNNFIKIKLFASYFW